MNRVKAIDSLKGLAASLVVLGHVADMFFKRQTFSDYQILLHLLVYITGTIMMPLFFYISGCTFSLSQLRTSNEFCQVRDKTKLKRSVLNFIVIYFIWSVLYCGLKMFSSIDVLEAVTIKTILMLPIRSVSLFWYLYVLIEFYILTPFLIGDKRKNRSILLLSFIPVVLADFINTHTISIFNLSRFFIYFFFFFLGLMTTKYFGKIQNNRKLISYGIFLVMIAGLVFGLAYKFSFFDQLNRTYIWLDIPAVGGQWQVCL